MAHAPKRHLWRYLGWAFRRKSASQRADGKLEPALEEGELQRCERLVPQIPSLSFWRTSLALLLQSMQSMQQSRNENHTESPDRSDSGWFGRVTFPSPRSLHLRALVQAPESRI
jgi:hypothetical protein